MSNFKNHLAFGTVFVALTYLVILYLTKFDYKITKFALYLPIIIFFILLPDIDSSSSVIRKFVNSFGLLIIIGSLVIYTFYNKNNTLIVIAIVTGIILFSAYFLKHRGFLHTVWSGLILSLPLIIFDPWLAVLAFLGYYSHLLLDYL